MADFILEQELDEIPSRCHSCGQIHGPEACGLHGDEEYVQGLDWRADAEIDQDVRTDRDDSDELA